MSYQDKRYRTQLATYNDQLSRTCVKRGVSPPSARFHSRWA